MILFACWIMLAIVFIVFGRLNDSRLLVSVGAVMILMTALVDKV